MASAPEKVTLMAVKTTVATAHSVPAISAALTGDRSTSFFSSAVGSRSLRSHSRTGRSRLRPTVNPTRSAPTRNTTSATRLTRIGAVVSEMLGLGTTQTEKTKTTTAPAPLARPRAMKRRTIVRRATAPPDLAAWGPNHANGARAIFHARRNGCRRTSTGRHLPPSSLRRVSHEPLWTPTEERIEGSTLARFAQHVGHDPHDYDTLWRWSVDDLEGFWQAVCDFFEVRFDTPPERVLGSREMPGAEWFPGSRLSFAEHVFRGKDPDAVAIRHASELRDETGRMVALLSARGVGEGDRVAAYLPNIPEAVAAFLATASIGAIWSSAAPEFGARSVVDRFSQIEPKVLLAVDGYRYGGKDFDRREVVKKIAAEIGDVPVIEFGYLSESGWAEKAEPVELEFAQLPFDHPLWVLYSSGTTGLPKSIVHGQGGILLEHLKKMHLHVDAQEGDRVFWFSTTGWMMWNFLVGVLLTPASIVLYDGNPAGDLLWQLAADTGMTTFGTSASFIAASMKEEI